MVRQAMKLECDCLKQGKRATNVLLDSERYFQKTIRDRIARKEVDRGMQTTPVQRYMATLHREHKRSKDIRMSFDYFTAEYASFICVHKSTPEGRNCVKHSCA